MLPRCRLLASHARIWRGLIATAALLACGESSSSPTAPPGGVAQISITPSTPTITLGAQLALQAQVRDAGGNLITGASVFWSSADTNVATVSTTGIVTGKSVGSTQIAASSGGQSARAVVTVTSSPVASVSVIPSNATLVAGGTTVMQAVTYDAGGQVLTGRPVVWASNATQVASVDATGKVTGVSAGTASISATSEGKTASATITVTIIPIASITIVPGSAALITGQTASLTAVATDANGNVLGGRPMVWTTADSAIAHVSTLGLVTAIGPGTTTIRATAEGKSGIAQVVVTAATPTPVGSVAVSPSTASLVAGGTVTLSATVRDANGATLSGRVVTWSSNAPQVATVSGSGVVTAVATGSATITATSEGKSGSSAITVSAVPVASVVVNPTSAVLLVGATTTISAVTSDANGNVLAGRVITWTSSSPSVATVSATGLVTAVGPGNTVITATSEGVSASATVAVSLAPVATVTLNPATASLVVGSATTITAVLKDANGAVLTGRTVTWVSNTPGVASVDANGRVTAVAAGSAIITATSEGKSAIATITVSLVPVASVTTSPTSTTIFVNWTATLSAITKDANGNILAGRIVTWTSSAPGIATVSATGLVTGVAPGTVTITATSEGVSAGATVVVTLAPVATVTLNQTTINLQAGSTAPITATMKDANNNVLTGRVVTWTSDASSIASVNSSGLVTAVAPGTAHITATSEGKTATATVTVVPVPVATVTLNQTTINLQTGSTTTITATTLDANNNVLTGRVVTWTSDASSIASVNSSGLVTAVAPGTAHITATSEGKTATATVTVVPVPVATVTLSQTTINLQAGSTTTITATTLDANNNVLTGRVVTWTSDASSIASVNSSGLVTAVAPGTAHITATSEGKTATATVTVVPVPVATVTLDQTTINLQAGSTTTITATTLDANNNVLTGRLVTWTSDASSIASVNSSGLVTAVAPGTAHITATSEGKTATATVTVVPVPVASVAVTPATASLSAAIQEQTTLSATPMDANNNPLAGRTIVWSSNATSVATVDPATGVVTAVAPGTATITATCEGVTGTSTITVNP